MVYCFITYHEKIMFRITNFLLEHEHVIHGTMAYSCHCQIFFYFYRLILETLSIEKGISFLNISSGSGYLSTSASLLIEEGVNHGIKLDTDVMIHFRVCIKIFLKKTLPLYDVKFNSVKSFLNFELLI